MASARPAQQKALPGKDGKNAGAPSQTLYVQNLNDKINKNELKRALYMLFSTYGHVLDIITTRVGTKGQNMRGQAHVVFRDVQTSTQAMRALQDFDLFGKQLKILYGKGQSQIIPKLRGTFEPSSVTAPASESTELQKSIFNAPPSSIPTRAIENGVKPSEANSLHGTKRPREEEEEEEEEDSDDAPMEEDDDDAPMEEDDDD